jgi:hypothetical protein
VTEALVEAGACGFKVAIRAQQVKEGIDDGTMRITVASACKDVMALAKELNGERPISEFLKPITNNIVFNSASKHIPCADCPIPSSILKAVRVEMGIALPKDVSVKFRRKSEEMHDSSGRSKEEESPLR